MSKVKSKRSREPENLFSKAEEIIRYFNETKRFVEELLRENERLRYKVLHMEQELLRSSGDGEGIVGGDVTAENRRLKEQLETIESHFDTLNEENADFRSRYHEVEKQNENLLNLYVSSYQLHSSLDENTVLSAFVEILLNLVGAEVFALWLVNQESGKLEIATVNDEIKMLPEGEPELSETLRDSMADGLTVFQAEHTSGPPTPLVCVPLLAEQMTVGVLAIYKLLAQKEEGFTSLDHDLLGLLTSASASALIGSKCFGRVHQTPLSLTKREGDDANHHEVNRADSVEESADHG